MVQQLHFELYQWLLLWRTASYQPCYQQNSAAPSSSLYNQLEAQQTHVKSMQKVF